MSLIINMGNTAFCEVFSGLWGYEKEWRGRCFTGLYIRKIMNKPIKFKSRI